MLRNLTLCNFKAFEFFELPFRPFSLIVGPNNAGKSTALSSLRVAAAMLATSRRLRPAHRDDYDDETWRTYHFAGSQFGLEEENLRHEFDLGRETSFDLMFASGGRLRAVWPPEPSGQSPFYFLSVGEAGQPRDLQRVREVFPTIGTVPILRPIDQHEKFLDAKYVQRSVGSRLASGHFRNQLFQMSDDDMAGFLDYVVKWLPEIQLRRPVVSGDEIDLYYKEGRTERELVWAGDGIQIFLQLLFHSFRLRAVETIVLDEPEVFLHADLQRRLLNLLEAQRQQVVLATHSSEIIVGAPERSLVWVDKSRARAVVAPDPHQLESLSTAMGSSFNLRLARVLRTRVALFVDGSDYVVLRGFAHTLRLRGLETEADIAVVPIEGSGDWTKLRAFDWIADNFLKGAVAAYVILNRDFWSDEVVAAREVLLRGAGLRVHSWSRHELESFLLVPEALARHSGAAVGWIDQQLDELTAARRDEMIAAVVGARAQEPGLRGRDPSTIVRSATAEVDAYWSEPAARLRRCPAKETLHGLNDRLAAAGYSQISVRSLVSGLEPSEIDAEVADLLWEIESVSRP